MDSLPPHPSNHDPLSSSASTARRRGSTSQMCLHRILATITTVPPPPPAAETNGENDARICESSPEEKEPLSSASSWNCDVDHEGGVGDRDVGSLSLLIEAAKLIFGDFVDGDKSELEEAEIGGGFGEAVESPAVRAKRGRTRVLPCRYRDSVLEPLPRFSRTGSTAAKRRRG
ncbi:hypothetical protein AAHA92_08203 [Salvia divinorum]|uniref:Uncharacterized protein n=1 Tax=Salvia divinorum TaxID=28513 RepID=A0ABD1HML8_SALDI